MNGGCWLFLKFVSIWLLISRLLELTNRLLNWKYDYEQVTYQDGEEWFNTTSENTGNPFIHLDDELGEII